MADDEVQLELLDDLFNAGDIAQELEQAQQQGEALASIPEGEDAERARKRAKKEGHDRSSREKRDKERKKDKKAKKDKKRRRQEDRVRSKFIDDKAGESGSESGNDEEEDADGEGELAEHDVEDYIKAHRPITHTFQEGDENLTAEEIARQIEERHQLHSRRSRGGNLKRGVGQGGGTPVVSGLGAGAAAGELSGELIPRKIPAARRFSTAYLPRPTDPKVFAVKCKPGMPRTLVTRIVNKCYHYRIGKNDEQKKVDLGVISVFSLEHVREYIYIEAHRQLFVENALNGLQGIFRFNITVVDPSELMQLMEFQPQRKETLKKGELVRLRNEPYRRDLAEVVEVLDRNRRAIVRVVPREDFVGKAYVKPDPKRKLPPILFDAKLAVGAHSTGDGHRWGDLTFDANGYMLKTVSTRAIIYGSQMTSVAENKPSTEELKRFFNSNKALISNVTRALCSAATPAALELKLGEMVRVVSGQLQNAVGTVVDITISTNTVKIACKVPGRAQPLEIRTELNNCVRHFVPGNHVGVESGPHQGRTGTVVMMHSDTMSILVDVDAEEIEVRVADCRQSRLVATTKPQLGMWRMLDLILLVDGVTVGIVVKCTHNALHIVTDKNLVRTVTPGEIKCAAKSRRSALDRMQNIIKKGDEVLIQTVSINVPAAVAGDTALVEQVFDEIIFVRSRKIFDNAGIIAVLSKDVILVGGKTSAVAVAPPKVLPMPEKKGHYASAAKETFSDAASNAESISWRTEVAH